MAATSSSVSRPAKRSRPESDELEEKPFKDHPTLYMDDGNVIITAGKTLFRVHVSLLANRSPVLRDLLKNTKEKFRGFLHLNVEDSSEDMEALLNVIYGGMRVDIQELTVETFPLIASTFRVSKKYQVNQPCQDILALFRAEWPPRLDAHDAAEEKFNAARVQPGGAAKEDLVVHPASAIALLRECGQNDPALLFPLFYSLSRRTWQFGGGALGHHIAPLAPADTERLVVGVELMRDTHARLVVTVPQIAIQTALGPHSCSAELNALWTAVVVPFLTRGADGQGGSRRVIHEPLEDWRRISAAVVVQCTQYGVCGGCQIAVVKLIEDRRRKLWTSLPTWFELAGA